MLETANIMTYYAEKDILICVSKHNFYFVSPIEGLLATNSSFSFEGAPIFPEKAA